MMGFNPDAAMPGGGAYVGGGGSLSPGGTSYQQMRGGAVGALPRGAGNPQRRRRSRRNLANVGDRAFEQVCI